MTYSIQDTIIKTTADLFMFVYVELKKKIYISLVVMETTSPPPPNGKEYLSLDKLVPVVIRKRSEKENEKRRFLISRQTHQEAMRSVSGSRISLGFVPLIQEFRLIEAQSHHRSN